MALLTAAVFSLLFAAISADYVCEFHRTSTGERKSTVWCALPASWDVGRFCCGTCKDRYCCSDPQKKLSEAEQKDCLLKTFDIFAPPPKSNDNVTTIAIGATVVGLIVFSVVFLICWVCPCCILHKRCRNPPPVIATVVTTQFLPPQIVINGGQYPPYQPLANNSEYGAQFVPGGPYQEQPCVPGPPPPYQEAVGYPVPNTPYVSDQHPVHSPAPSGKTGY